MKANSADSQFVAQYRQVGDKLRSNVRSGMWRAGSMLPSRRDLAREFRVSSVTIGRAVDTLIAEGLLFADSRRGTFVAEIAEPIPRVSAPNGVYQTKESPTSATLLVGIVATVDDVVNNQSASVLHSIEHTLAEAGHVTTVHNRVQPASGSLDTLDSSVSAHIDQGVDALAVICLELDREQIEESLKRVNLNGTPTVLVLAGSVRLPIPHVFYDNRIGGYQAAQHLLDKGHRKISVFAPFTASWVGERIAGVRDAIAQSNTPVPEIDIFVGDGNPWDYLADPTVAGSVAAKSALGSGWKPSGALICISDQVAHGVMHVLRENGYLQGRDYAIVGFDDEKCARLDGLTTLRPPLEAMGREAVRLLLDEVGGNRTALQVRLRAHLIARASTNFAVLTPTIIESSTLSPRVPPIDTAIVPAS